MIKQLFSSQKKSITFPFDSSSKKKKKQIDRFIPHSVSKNLYSMFSEVDSNRNDSQSLMSKNYGKNYSDFLEQNLMNDHYLSSNQSKVLHFGQTNNYVDKQNVSMNIESVFQKQEKNQKKRKIASDPYKILQAPHLKDDFYLNLVDWSDNNQIGVGLKSSLLVWSGCSSKVKKVYQSKNLYEQICSVRFMRHNSKVSIGTNQGKVRIFDLHKSEQCSNMSNLHSGRIGSLGCTNNLIVTGSKDGYVSIQDYRTDRQVFRYKAHQQEISGLQISPDNEMIATGGNDNRMLLFSMKMMDKMACWDQHNAAVKAIGFNPKAPQIASGGGTADKKIRVFSLQTLQKVSEVDTGSQVCNLRYSPVSNELVSTHGYSLNQIILWKYDNKSQLTKVDSLTGHKSRVLYLAGQSQGSKIVTGAGDQELRLWKIFDDSMNRENNSFDLR